MAHINLLPWRDERREQRKREFLLQLVMAGVVGVVVVFAWAFWMGQRVDNQQDRNAYLKDQIKQVDAKIAKIKSLEKVRSQLLARKQIIEKLQSNRSQMVHMFDALVKTIPDSVRLTALKQDGQNLTLDGVAQSNASVADYMRQLAASPWLGVPHLQGTVNHHDGSRMPYSFGFDLTLAKPTDAEHEAAEEQAAEEQAAKTGATQDGGTVTVTPTSSSAPAGSTAPAASAAPKVALPVVAPKHAPPAEPSSSASASHGRAES